MKKFLRLCLCSSLSVVLLSGCSIYHPQAVDIPLINHQGDLRVDASLGVSSFIIPDIYSINVTGSYGISSLFSAQVHANFGGNCYYFQAAPGIYFPLGAKSVFETYVGVGHGGSWADNLEPEDDVSNASNNDYNFDGRFLLPFLQANFGWHDLGRIHFDFAIGLKAGIYMPDYNYYELDSNGNRIASSEQAYTSSQFLFEPQLRFRFGSEKLKFGLSFGFAWLGDMNDGENSYNFYYDPFTVSAGVTFTL